MKILAVNIFSVNNHQTIILAVQQHYSDASGVKYRHYSLDGYPWLILANTRHTWLSFHTLIQEGNDLKTILNPLCSHCFSMSTILFFCLEVPTMQCNISPSSWDHWCMLIGQPSSALLSLILVCRKITWQRPDSISFACKYFPHKLKNMLKNKHKKYTTPKCCNYIPYNPSP